MLQLSGVGEDWNRMEGVKRESWQIGVQVGNELRD